MRSPDKAELKKPSEAFSQKGRWEGEDDIDDIGASREEYEVEEWRGSGKKE